MTVDSLGRRLAGAALARLDRDGNEAVSLSRNEAFQRPFGVLKLVPDEVSADTEQNGQQKDQVETLQAEWEPLVPLENVPSIGEDHNGKLGDMVQDSENFMDSTLALDVDTIPSDLTLLDSLDASFHEFLRSPLSTSPSPISLTLSSKHIPPQAPDILRHFEQNILTLSFPLRNCRNCAWQTIHLPAAMSTYAELSILGTTSHIKLSLFYSLLAASCINLFTRDQNALGLDRLGGGFKQIAKQHIEQALNEEAIGPKQGKYKELLMGVLSMVMISGCQL